MAECLYYGDKPIGLIQSNAEDVEYSTGVSVKDKIDELSPQTILSIPANTYQTTRQALVALYNAYMTIPDELKTKAKIIVRDQVVYTLNDLTNKTFTYVAVQSIQTVIYSLYLSQNSAGCFYLSSEIKPNTGNTIVDRTDGTQTNKIDLIV